MRSVKTTGGLTKGRGMLEEQRAKWLRPMPQYSEINTSLQQATNIDCYTSTKKWALQ